MQWSDKKEKNNNDGKISVADYVTLTFPKGTWNNIVLDSSKEEDCIVLGVVEDEISDVKGNRVSDLLKKYPQSGLIKSVNDNSNRTMLPNIKVVLD